MSFEAIKSNHSVVSSAHTESSSLSLSRPTQSPTQDDISWFSATIKSQNTATDPNVAERIVDQLAGSSKELQNLSNDANRALRKASRSSDPKDVIQANRALSSFYLESLLTTKLISKGTQAVEKITSLQ